MPKNNYHNLIKYSLISLALIISACLFSYVYAKTGFTIGSPYGMQLKNTTENLIYGVASTTQLTGNLMKLQTFTSPSTYADKFIISKTGRISINSSSPNANSSLFIASSTGNAEIDIQSAGQNYWAIYQQYTGPNIGDLQFWNTGTTNILTLTDTTGYIGINTQSPEGRLTVNGDVGIGDPANTVQGSHMLDVASTKGNVDNSAIRATYPAGGGLAGTEFGALAYRNGVWGAVYGKAGTGGALAGYFDGDVGIGTNNPSSTLKVDVEGNAGANNLCNENGGKCLPIGDCQENYFLVYEDGAWTCQSVNIKPYPLRYFISTNTYNGNLVRWANARAAELGEGSRTFYSGLDAGDYLCTHDPSVINSNNYYTANLTTGPWGYPGIEFENSTYGTGAAFSGINYLQDSPTFWSPNPATFNDCLSFECDNTIVPGCFCQSAVFKLSQGQPIGSKTLSTNLSGCCNTYHLLCVQKY